MHFVFFFISFFALQTDRSKILVMVLSFLYTEENHLVFQNRKEIRETIIVKQLIAY